MTMTTKTSVKLFDCSSVRMFNCSNDRQFEWSTVRIETNRKTTDPFTWKTELFKRKLFENTDFEKTLTSSYSQSFNSFLCYQKLYCFKACHPTFTDKTVRRPSVAIHFATTLTPFVKPREVLRGYLDVAIAKIRKTLMQSCAIDLQTCSFVNFLQWLHLNNLAKKQSRKYLVSESRGAPSKEPNHKNTNCSS